jgi:hypothetical protein
MRLPAFLKDPKGKDSSMRVKLFLLLLCGLFVIVWQVVHQAIDHVLIVEILGICFGFKVWQNKDENKQLEIDKKDRTNP